ncbi:Ydc2-catalyt-domain-containing protein [Hypomontagnella submonticulosa]|nr:Ydc2-catalyt-domain-containing protein [Hypomontagnella submonticulosa]
MSSTLEKILPKLKLVEVKQLAVLCGVKSSGTKPEVINRLSAVASARSAAAATTRDSPLVLSVDLGIRNLSYCLMSPASPPRPPKLLSSAAALCDPRPVHVHKWRLQRLVQEVSPDNPEPFSPESLAVVTNRLLQEELLPLKPTHMLIERQRWRSGGAPTILQWTVHVNTLEAMLHASLRTMKELGHLSEEVRSVSPANVARFWLPVSLTMLPQLAVMPDEKSVPEQNPGGALNESQARKARQKVKGKANSKKQKMSLLESWLQRASGKEVVLPTDPDAKDTVQQFIQQFRQLRIGRKFRDPEKPSTAQKKLEKLDDLTDSLLQGVTWLKWEEHQASLLTEEGITMLQETKLLDEQNRRPSVTGVNIYPV